MAHFSALADTNSVFTFFLPNNAAFSALKSRGAFDSTVMRGHIIPDEVVFLRSVEDCLSDGEPTRKPAGVFASLLNGAGPALDSFLGIVNSSGQRTISLFFVRFINVSY